MIQSSPLYNILSSCLAFKLPSLLVVLRTFTRFPHFQLLSLFSFVSCRLWSFPTTQRTDRFYLVVNRSENIVPGRTNDRAGLAFGKLFDISTEIVRSERTNSVVHHPSTEFHYIQLVRSNNINCRGSSCVCRWNRPGSGIFCKVRFCNVKRYFSIKLTHFSVKDTNVRGNTIQQTS